MNVSEARIYFFTDSQKQQIREQDSVITFLNRNVFTCQGGLTVFLLCWYMDVTCGISFNPASSSMLQFEEALLAENYENIEKFCKKMRKKREVSEGKRLMALF